MADVKAISSYFIFKSSKVEENDLTNLKLQKILYYAQAECYKNNKRVLFNDAIEAWKFGPVVSKVYNWLKGCGAYPITTFDIETDYSKLSDDLKKYLDSIWNKYGKYSASYLVKKTHEPDSPWSKTYQKHENSTISLDVLKTAKLQNEWKQE